MFNTIGPCPSGRWKKRDSRIANWGSIESRACTIAIDVTVGYANREHKTKILNAIANFLNEHSRQIDAIIGPEGHNV
jgi:hypothetical protein